MFKLYLFVVIGSTLKYCLFSYNLQIYSFSVTIYYFILLQLQFTYTLYIFLIKIIFSFLERGCQNLRIAYFGTSLFVLYYFCSGKRLGRTVSVTLPSIFTVDVRGFMSAAFLATITVY